MKTTTLLFLTFLLLSNVKAQKNNNISELVPLSQLELQRLASIPDFPAHEMDASSTLPAMVDNSLLSFFRPLFNQSGLECGQAASIGLNFTYEMNLLRNVPGNVPQNQYATHFTYNFINGGSDAGVSYFETWEIVKRLGTPTVADYGGLALGGASRWMTGYDKYYNAMHNRVKDVFTIKAGDEAGLAQLKGWLYNHSGTSSVGGLANIYIQYKVPDAQLAAGTPDAGKWVITTWGGSPNHAITLVGYNDSIRWDYNGDGQYTNTIDINGDGAVNMKDWEIGAFKIANTYGGINSWGNLGFSYVMYKTFADNLGSGGIWNHATHIIKVKQDVTPKITFKVKIKHTSRNKLKIIAGVSQNTAASEPDMLLQLPVFDYQGGDKFMTGGTTEADKTIEVGIDATPLLSSIASGQPAKFFLMLDENDPDALATGEILNFSIISYSGTTNEIACSSTNVPIVENGMTTLFINATLNFDLPVISTNSLPEAKIYEPYSTQLLATAGTSAYQWKYMCDYTEVALPTTFPTVTANQLSVSSTSNGFTEVLLPFEFPFYGKKYNKLYAHVDGYLMFEPDLYPWTFIIYEKTFFKNTKNISPYMSKPLTLFPTEGDGIWYQGDQNGIIFRWKSGMYGSGPTTDLNFAVKLFPDGKIEFYYDDIISNSWVSWNAGISQGDGVNFHALSIVDSLTQPAKNSMFQLTTLPFPTELSITDNGILSGTPSKSYTNVPMKFYVQDNNNLFATKTLNFNTKGVTIQYAINSGGDTLLDYGETAHLSATLKNIGSAPLSDLLLEFSVSDSYISLLDSIQIIGSLLPGQSITVPDAISFFISNQVLDSHVFNTISKVVTSQEIFTRNLSMEALAPVVKVTGVSMVDGNNTILMPGENAIITLTLKNRGGASCENLNLHFAAIDPYLTINQSDTIISMIGSSDSVRLAFPISISASCPNGYISLANLYLSADKEYSVTDSVFFNIGVIAEDFETNNFLRYPWHLSGNSNWVVNANTPYQGTYSANSPVLSDNQWSNMTISLNVLSASEISFYYKVSSENNYDFLRFYIDGVEQAKWSGEVAWAKAVFPVQAGTHTFVWNYSKDYSVSAGSDKAWVDFIIWPANDDLLLIANAGNDDFMCTPSLYALNPSIVNAESVFWTTAGDGSFDNSTISKANYLPGNGDIINGGVVLTIHASRAGMNASVDNMTLAVYKGATVNCGNNASVCQYNPFYISQATAENYTNLMWTTSGDGFFNDNTILNPQYYPGIGDKNYGSVMLILTASGLTQCSVVVDTLLLFIQPYITAYAGANQTINHGAYTQLTGSASGSAVISYHWQPEDLVLTPNQPTTFTENLISSSVLTLTATDFNTGCYNVDTVIISVVGGPMGVSVEATPTNICRSSWSQLNALASGGSGNYTYNWTSIPAGFTSFLPNPMVAPLESTQYFVLVDDGASTVESSVLIQVDTITPEQPSQPIGPVSVNTIIVPVTQYQSVSNGNSENFKWKILPTNAGVINFFGASCTIEWDSVFEGIAYLALSDSNSCGESTFSEDLIIQVSRTISTPENASKAEMYFVPNPASSIVHIYCELTSNVECLVINHLGQIQNKEILEFNGCESKLNVSKLMPGVYTVVLKSGAKSFSDKLIIIK